MGDSVAEAEQDVIARAAGLVAVAITDGIEIRRIRPTLESYLLAFGTVVSFVGALMLVLVPSSSEMSNFHVAITCLGLALLGMGAGAALYRVVCRHIHRPKSVRVTMAGNATDYRADARRLTIVADGRVVRTDGSFDMLIHERRERVPRSSRVVSYYDLLVVLPSTRILLGTADELESAAAFLVAVRNALQLEQAPVRVQPRPDEINTAANVVVGWGLVVLIGLGFVVYWFLNHEGPWAAAAAVAEVAIYWLVVVAAWRRVCPTRQQAPKTLF